MARRPKTLKTTPVEDRGEATSQMEPLVISSDASRRGELTDLAVDLAARAAGFKRSIPEGMVAPLADQALRIVNPLHARGVITSLHSKAPWRLTFPVSLAQRWMPGLYPEAARPVPVD